MVTMMVAAPPPGNGGSGLGALLLLGVCVLAFYFVKVQLNPLIRCTECPKPKADGSYHRCRKCGGSPERLKTAAWVMMRLGIPVPRARHLDKKHPMAVPKDYRRE